MQTVFVVLKQNFETEQEHCTNILRSKQKKIMDGKFLGTDDNRKQRNFYH